MAVTKGLALQEIVYIARDLNQLTSLWSLPKPALGSHGSCTTKVVIAVPYTQHSERLGSSYTPKD